MLWPFPKIHSIIMLNCLKQNHTIPLPRGPQITPELEMRNIAFFQTACLSEGAERAFSCKAKLWSLWSVGHVAEEMLIMWLYAGLVCCDLEGSSHGAMGLGEMRGVTTGTALGKKKKSDPNTVKLCIFSPILWSSLYKHFPNVTGVWHILHCGSICLATS